MKPNKLRMLCAFLTLGLVVATSTASATVLLSQSKPVTASSEQTNTNPTNTAVKGNDGSLSTRWSASTSSYPQWWKVDLGMNYTLGSATINWYSSASRAYKYKIEVSTDDSTYTLVKDNTGNTTFGDTTDTFSTVVGRYVKVTVTGCSVGSAFAGFYECQIFENSGVPPAATGLISTEGNTQVALSWTAATGATGYDVQRATAGGGPYTTIASNVSGVSYTDTAVTNGTGYYYVVRSLNATGEGSPTNEAAATPTNLPNPWLTQDIGTVGALGSASYSSSIYTAAGGGADIGGTLDAFRYIYQAATGDCTVIARVATLQNTNAAAKAGVMIRDSLAANAISAAVVVTPTSGILFEYRTSSGGATTTSSATGFAAPYWVKLVRTGNSFTAFRSPDGTTWTQIGAGQTITMGSTAYIGFPVSSHVAGTLCTATFDNVSPGVTTPAAPSGLGATAVSASQINLAWTDNSSNETGFRIERKTGVGGTYAEIATVGSNVTTYSDITGLSPSTTYYYQVRAYNAGGNSAYSASANATTLVPPPLAPSNVTFTGITSSGVTVNWVDNSSDETGFKVERKTGAGGTYAEVGSTTAANVITLADSGLSTFTQYYYRVKATNAGGDSGYAAEMPVTTLDTIPAAPTGLSIGSPTSSSITLTWTDNSNGATGNETGFKVERRTGAGSFVYLATAPAGTTATETWVDTSAASGTSYSYRVSAVNSGGTSGVSNVPTNISTTGTAIAAATSVAGTADPNVATIDLTWTDNSGGTAGYIIERSTTGLADSFTVDGTVGAGVTSFNDPTALGDFTTYYYRVRANNGTNNSPYSANITVVSRRATPTNLAGTELSTAQVNLTWTDNSNNEIFYWVEKKVGAGGTYSQIAQLNANTTTYTNSSLALDTAYYYRVRAAGGSTATHSLYSNETSVTLFGTPSLTATPGGPTQINLTWTESSTTQTGFKIERKPDVSGAFTEIATVGNVTSYPDTGLAANTSYIYRIRAYNSTNTSLYSNRANATTSLGGGLPSPWLDTDVGTPTLAGSSSYASGTFTVEGSGSDIWGTADGFHYVYQPVTGDCTIIAHVTNMDNTNASAKAGVMIREVATGASAPGSKQVMMILTPGYWHGSAFYYRATTGGSTVSVTPEDGVGAPYWLKLVRSGDRFTGYKSSDGTTWVSVGSTTVAMASAVYVGLPVCSKSTGLCKAGFDNVSVTTGSVPVAPAAPSVLGVTAASTSELDLSWTDNSSNETGFKIERKTGLSGKYALLTTVGANVTTYQNPGLAAATTYYYRVSAYNAGGDSDYSVETGIATQGGPTPSIISQGKLVTASSEETNVTPKNYAINGNDGDSTTRWGADSGTYPQWWKVDLGAAYPLTKISINWYSSGGRSYKYTVLASTDDVTYTQVVNRSTNTTSGLCTDTFSATARYIKVNVTSCSTGGFASFYECQVFQNGSEPAAVTSLTATADSVKPNQINLAWTDNSTNETGFKIERQTGGTGANRIFSQVATAAANATSYSDTGLAAGTQYYYRVLATSATDGDALAYSNTANATTNAVTSSSFTRKYWTGITGTTVASLTSNVNFPATPTGTGYLNTLEAPFDWADNYGQMIDGLVHAPTTGNYTFWISSADNSELWLSTDSNPANAVLIAKVADKTNPRDWDKHLLNAFIVGAAQNSATISLVGGQSYYIKALHKAGDSTTSSYYTLDNLAVAWQGPGFSRQVLSDTGSPLVASLTSPSDGATITEGSNVTINASATAGTGRSIVKVEFLLYGDTKVESKLGEDTTSPYSFAWNGVTSGSYILTARAWDDAGVSTSSSVKVTVTNSTFGSGTWAERILNGDGTMNWTEYANVANNYDRRDMLEYRFGPNYGYYHPTPETFHTLMNQSGANGVLGHAYISGTESDWYSEGGQLVFSPNTTAPSTYQPGVAQAWNGDIYTFNGASPEYCFINGVQWNHENGHGMQVPDPSINQQSWKDANGGSSPMLPVATVRTGGLAGITGFLLYKNGFIGGAGNGGTDGYDGATPYPFTQLDAGKVPTAGAVTINNEFLLVTVWDTINNKGQVAVLAINGQIRAQQALLVNGSHGEYFWGLPNRFTVRSMKLLGYVDLPFNAPSAIKVSNDMSQKDGVGSDSNDNLSLQLNSQTERDEWYNWSGNGDDAFYHKTPKAGYAVVASRAENKVAFLDLQPLFEYYRQMYFTTQANYDLTKNQGAAANQWPHTFAYAPAQTPTLYATLNITAPTALLAGPPQNPNGGSGTTDAYKTNAYIATMDGHLYIYNIGDLITTASGGSIGAPTATITIGKNPTSIDNNVEFRPGTVVNCRGDKAISLFDPSGVILYTLKDSRIQDAVYTMVSQNGRGSYGMSMVHVLDFEGNQILTYRWGSTTSTPPISLPVDETGPSGMEYTHTDPMPGCPFMFTRMGEN